MCRGLSPRKHVFGDRSYDSAVIADVAPSAPVTSSRVFWHYASVGIVAALSLDMAHATKAQIKTVQLRLATLRAELDDAFTARCGEAAKKCIREDIAVWENELDRLLAA